MNEPEIETLQKVRTHLEDAWWDAEHFEIRNALDDLIDVVDSKIHEERQK